MELDAPLLPEQVDQLLCVLAAAGFATDRRILSGRTAREVAWSLAPLRPRSRKLALELIAAVCD